MRSFQSFALLVAALAMTVSCASIEKNLVYDAPRLHSGDALVGDVVNDCLVAAESMACLKGKVLTFLDTQLNVHEEQGRNVNAKDMDELIYERAGRLLAMQHFQIPLIDGAQLSYAPEQGLDIDLPTQEGLFQYSIQISDKARKFFLNFPKYRTRTFAEEKTTVPDFIAVKIENESADANFRGHDRFEGNESVDSVQVGHHHCARFHRLPIGHEEIGHGRHANDDRIADDRLRCTVTIVVTVFVRSK